jgi:hypothetical protein
MFFLLKVAMYTSIFENVNWCQEFHEGITYNHAAIQVHREYFSEIISLFELSVNLIIIDSVIVNTSDF